MLGWSMVVVEAAYVMGPLSGFRVLRAHDDGDDPDSEWWHHLCLAQGCTFQLGLTAMMLLFVWFEYAQFLMLVERVPSQEVQRREPLAIAVILTGAACNTAMPLATGHIGPRENFYG